MTDKCNGIKRCMRMCLGQREIEYPVFKVNDNNWGLCGSHPNPQGFQGMGASSGYPDDLR